MSRPIKPSEVIKAKTEAIPDFVWDSFNELIAEKINNGRAVIKQSDVVDRILEKNPNVKRQEIFDKGWLNVESAYVKAGWTVATYDSPGYCESYPATFTFVTRG